MVNIRGYLSANFTKSFLTIFLPLFFIISLVYLVKISALTAQIQITFGELLQLFGYFIPPIIFYTLPISFVTAVAVVLLRLSGDNELIALFSLGFPSKNIIYPLMLIAVLFSVLLLIISFAAMPQTKQLFNAFKENKKEEMSFNIIPEELGQKFGSYYIYAKSEAKGKFQDIVIYNQDKNQSDQIFSAHNGLLGKSSGVFALELFDGKGYTFAPDKIQQITYRHLQLYDTLRKNGSEIEDIGNFVKKSLTDIQRQRKLLFFIFISLIPILSLYLVASFAIINPRYQKNHLFVLVGLAAFYFYIIAFALERKGTVGWLIISIAATFAIGYWLFRRQVRRFF